MAVNLTFSLNGTDYSRMVERDSYATGLIPVYSDAVTTFDGVDHMVLIRSKGTVTVGLNPQTAADTKSICEALNRCPVTVKYHCLQRNTDVTANMIVSQQSAKFLSRCKARGYVWNEIDAITLEEL